MENDFSILAVKTENDFSEAKLLFLDYAKELNLNLCFQNFDNELKEISIQYNVPSGFLLLLKYKNEFIGCVGLRKIKDGVSEVKRMYIKKEFRGNGLSKKLIEEIVSHAKKMNYKTIRLDTLPQMKEAVNLYLAFGFKEIQSYRFNPVPKGCPNGLLWRKPIDGTKYMELTLWCYAKQKDKPRINTNSH